MESNLKSNVGHYFVLAGEKYPCKVENGERQIQIPSGEWIDGEDFGLWLAENDKGDALIDLAEIGKRVLLKDMTFGSPQQTANELHSSGRN